jgi:hypothetical protein
MGAGTHTLSCLSFEYEHHCRNVSESLMLESAWSDFVFWGLFSKWSVLGSAGSDGIDHPEECDQTFNHKICLLHVFP